MKSAKPVIAKRERDLTQPLSTQEQFEYAKKAMAGNSPENQQARERLVLSMKGLIIKLARDAYNVQYSQLEDVIQEAYAILWQIFSPPDKTRSIQARFDPSFEVKPSTYAAFWIQFAITNYLSHNRIIAVPRTLSYLIMQFKEWSSGSPVTTAKIIEFIETHKTRKTSFHAIRYALTSEHVVSLDKDIRKHDKTTFLDLLGNEIEAGKDIKDKKIAIIDQAIKESLTEREIKIMDLRYDKGYSQQAIGDMFGVTGSRIGQIIKNAQRKIKRWILEHYPDLQN